MFNSYNKQNDTLARFRIRAHLRSYVKDPIIVDEKLLMEAVSKLKKLPYDFNDPADAIAIELTLEAYRLGYFKYEDLTDSGCKLIRHSKYRRHRHTNDRAHHGRTLRSRYTLKTI